MSLPLGRLFAAASAGFYGSYFLFGSVTSKGANRAFSRRTHSSLCCTWRTRRTARRSLQCAPSRPSPCSRGCSGRWGGAAALGTTLRRRGGQGLRGPEARRGVEPARAGQRHTTTPKPGQRQCCRCWRRRPKASRRRLSGSLEHKLEQGASQRYTPLRASRLSTYRQRVMHHLPNDVVRTTTLARSGRLCDIYLCCPKPIRQVTRSGPQR